MRDVCEIRWLKNVDSTNIEAERRLDTLDNMSVIAAFNQSGGRGQGDHSWHSEPGANLLFSVVFKPPVHFPAADAESVSHATALSLLDYLEDNGISAAIKWPNDIWVADRKICGILIKTRIFPSGLQASIIGIGLNVNETVFPSDLPNPVSMKNITGKTYDLEQELEKLHKKICRRLGEALLTEGRLLLQEEFGKKVFRLP